MLEAHFLYFPIRDLRGSPAEVRLAFEEVFITTVDGVRLHGWRAEQHGANPVTKIVGLCSS